MTDLIRIQQLKVAVRIGVSESERSQTRPIIVNIDLATDTRTSGASDELHDTVDYGRLIRKVAELAETGEFHLLEHLAEKVAALVSQENGVKGAKIEIVKVVPPVDEDVEAVSVVIERP